MTIELTRAALNAAAAREVLPPIESQYQSHAQFLRRACAVYSLKLGRYAVADFFAMTTVPNRERPGATPCSPQLESIMQVAASLIALLLVLTPTAVFSGEGFDVIVLGASGGIQDGNLSSYLIRPHGDRNAIACDAGSLVNGLKVAQEKGVFRDTRVPQGSIDSVVGHVLKNEIKGYLISHAHLDHVGGLINFIYSFHLYKVTQSDVQQHNKTTHEIPYNPIDEVHDKLPAPPQLRSQPDTDS